MSDIILIEFRGKAWLVRGAQYIDELLINDLPPELSMEIITCEAESEVNDHWLREGYDRSMGQMPWMIHPGIVNRIRRSLGGPGGLHNVFFGQWSALLDEEALEVLKAVAAKAEAEAGHGVYLVTYTDADQPRAMMDLTNVRCSLLEAELARLGVAEARIAREAREGKPEQEAAVGKDRIDIRVGES